MNILSRLVLPFNASSSIWIKLSGKLISLILTRLANELSAKPVVSVIVNLLSL